LRFALVGNGGVRLAAARWLPRDDPWAAVVFAHGYTAHMGSYGNVRQTLVDAGCAVHALDHRGHGASEGKRASLDRFDDIVEDFERLVELTRAEWPGLPVFTLGHSMGGLIVARHALSYQDGLAGTIAVSAAFVVGEHVGDRTVRALVFLSGIVPNLPAIGEKQPVSDHDTPGPARRARDIFHYHGKVRLNMARELRLTGLDTLDRAPAWRLPILLQHGTDDKVTSPTGSEQAWLRASSLDRAVELWPGRHHNLLTDEGWEEPVGQIVAWLFARSSAGSGSPAPDLSQTLLPAGR
jgi:alpha-beta hydrolase superfamily lysophospholipase